MGKAMKKTRNTQSGFPQPKRGKWRSQSPMKKASIQNVKYVRHGQDSAKTRMEQATWSCSLKQIYKSTDKQLVQMLTKQNILKDWAGQTCPRCEHGNLSKLCFTKGRGFTYKCGARGCRQYILPHDQHPVFSTGSGQNHVTLEDQAAVLFCAVANTRRGAAHLFTERNHKFVEGIYARLDQARCDFVEKKEKSIKFGSGEQWKDVEADEVDLRKKTEPLASPSVKSTSWEQWGGIVERGAPETLVLTRLKPCRTKARAPGPGPMRKRDWAPTASKYLKGCNVVLHTDGARAYKLKLDGVIHDNVCHSKKRIGHGGRSGWNNPTFVKTVTHTLPDGQKLRVKAGTQIIDRFWRHLRSHLEGHTAGVGSATLRRRVRSAQWTYWHKGDDLWAKTGELFQSLMA